MRTGLSIKAATEVSFLQGLERLLAQHLGRCRGFHLGFHLVPRWGEGLYASRTAGRGNYLWRFLTVWHLKKLPRPPKMFAGTLQVARFKRSSSRSIRVSVTALKGRYFCGIAVFIGMSRPFRAFWFCVFHPQGVALGYHITPRRG